jgi:hypothetical protein
MSNRRNPNPDELSFGIELEFLFYYKSPKLKDDHDAEALTVDPEEEALLPPALVLPDHVEDKEPDFDEWEDLGSDNSGSKDGDKQVTQRDWAADLIQQAILSVPGAKLNRKPMPAGTSQLHRDMYVVTSNDDEDHDGWDVKNDGSVRDDGITVLGYRRLAFEITSPALWDRPESHTHVYLVVRELLKRFRLRVNLSTGFHVHVGAGLGTGAPDNKIESTSEPGPDDWCTTRAGSFDEVSEVPGPKHSLGLFKRAAALMWAADGFLAHSQPPERGLNEYVPPLRYWSRLAHGVQLRHFYDSKGEVKRYEQRLDASEAFEAPSDLLPDRALPSHNFARQDPSFFPVLRPNTVDAAAQRRFETVGAAEVVHPEAHLLPKQTVYSGIGHIMRCRNHSGVARLFSKPSSKACYDRLNYNLKNYLPNHKFVHLDSSGTVEFREATGSLSPGWVSTWTSICLGMFRFARDGSDARFWAVIDRLARAEAAAQRPNGKGREHDGGYDMISLLFDMGLFAEALFLERALRGADPLRFWYPNRLAEPFVFEELEYPEPTLPRVDSDYEDEYEEEEGRAGGAENHEQRGWRYQIYSKPEEQFPTPTIPFLEDEAALDSVAEEGEALEQVGGSDGDREEQRLVSGESSPFVASPVQSVLGWSEEEQEIGAKPLFSSERGGSPPGRPEITRRGSARDAW